MTYILYILIALSLAVSLTGLYMGYSQKRYLRSLMGDNQDPVEILRRLKLHQLRQKDLKRLIDQVQATQEANTHLLEKSFNRIGLVRFNPYRDTGGDQSFSMCLLNTQRDGVIITTIHGREGTRVYAKPIVKARAQYDLSNEESSALQQALE